MVFRMLAFGAVVWPGGMCMCTGGWYVYVCVWGGQEGLT